MYQLLNKYKLLNIFLKKYSSAACIYNEEFTVNTFCKLFIKSPLNIHIKPLDVHLYPNCDKLKVKIFTPKDTNKFHIKCVENQDEFHISTESSEENGLECLIVETPVKSDLNVSAFGKASIDIKKINGNTIISKSELGDITSHSCQTTKIHYITNGGNISTTGTLHAAEIDLVAGNNGNISINHMQSLNSNLITENGDISVKSSYCDQSNFKTHNGKLNLDNIHKNCLIKITGSGNLQMTGFDGNLSAFVHTGTVDIQVSKLYDKSSIMIQNKSELLLRLSDWIQENTAIKTMCKELKIDDDMQLMDVQQFGTDYVLIKPKGGNKTKAELIVDSKLGFINVKSASWSDMLKMKGIHFDDK